MTMTDFDQDDCAPKGRPFPLSIALLLVVAILNVTAAVCSLLIL